MSDDDNMKNTLDVLLEGHSDKFKAEVSELVRQNKWESNDPAFTISVAFGQLEVLLRQYPAEFAALLTDILEDVKVRCL